MTRHSHTVFILLERTVYTVRFVPSCSLKQSVKMPENFEFFSVFFTSKLFLRLGRLYIIYVLFNYDCSCLHSVGSVDSMISELESMGKEEAAWRFPVGIHKNRGSRSSYRPFKLRNFEYKEGMLTSRPS